MIDAIFADFKPLSLLIIGVLAASVCWLVPVAHLWDKLTVARWEASHLRVCRCQLRAHHDNPVRGVASTYYPKPKPSGGEAA